MKKIYIALAALAAAALTSCVNEKPFENVTPVGENGIAFSVAGGATRSGDNAATVVRGAKMSLASDVEGHTLLLEETITSLDEMTPATKGTPAYTENVGVLYANQLFVHADGFSAANADATFANMDGAMVGGGWRYQHNYGADPWPEDGSAVGFYLRMPETMNGVIAEEETDPLYTYSDGTISFDFVTPDAATNQQDILFAYRTLTKEQHNTYLPNGAPVLFNHALTAVKFAIANHDDDAKISIKSISFTGLVGSGHCDITPVGALVDNTKKEYRDSITNYTSASASVTSWTLDPTDSKTTVYSSGEFADTVMFSTGGSFKDKSGNNNGSYPNSFAAAGNLHNLNDSLATQTFWFIPQAMTDDVMLTIEYTFGSDEVRTGVLEFGTALAGVTWEAGQLRTYTIRVDEVNVMIDDTVVPTKTENAILTDIDGDIIYKKNPDGTQGDPYTFTAYGGTKSAVTIENTGNTDAYIRAALIGQWLDSDGNPVFGFTDYTAGKVVLVDSWYQDQFVSKNGYHGEFVNLPGYTNTHKTTSYGNPLNKWYLNNDGYYYYKDPVAPGKIIGTAPTGATNASDYLGNPLFTSYTVGTNPAVVVAGAVKDVYFVLEISTQAVSAKKTDGTNYTLSEAWSRAGVTVTYPAE